MSNQAERVFFSNIANGAKQGVDSGQSQGTFKQEAFGCVMVGSIIVAFIGAVILVGITRLIKRA